MKKHINTIKNCIGLGLFSFLLVFFEPLSVFAETKEDAYTNMNTVLTIATFLGGFMVIFGIIRSGMKLAASQDNPQNRTAGIIGLCFAFLGGYMIYKAVDILNIFF